ncbi:AAA family ATPase [Planococcus sp. APC 4015]|nr:AAA family ATPase [Planococcus sp. APC 4015]
MSWPAEIESKIDEAMRRVDAGRPTVLNVQGHGGFGKTRLAREVARRFAPSQVLRATAYEETQSDPFDLLAQLGVPQDDGKTNPLRAAQALGALIDGLQPGGTVVLVIDDLQWADAESLDAIGVLLERMAGDRLLVIAAHRPVGPRHERWRANLEGAPDVVHVVLDGLDDDAAHRMIQDAAPDAPRSLAVRLREHTGGSPLFLRSLLHEHSVDQLQALARADDLPATTELAATMGERISQMDAAVVATLSAVAVLGDRGGDPFTIRAVAGVDDVDSALKMLSADRLVITDGHGQTANHRIFHGIVRAAVYDVIPHTTRDRMHGAAAARMADARDRLRHRIAAARRTDDGLAVDLDVFADELHDRGRFREAALFRRRAARLSSDTADASRRRLDADFEAIIALDLEELSIDQDAVALDPYERTIVGSKLAAELRWVAAARMLSHISDDDLAALTPLAQYRTRVLRALSFVASGGSPHDALRDLESAGRSPVIDPALQGYVTFAAGQAGFLTVPVDQGMPVVDRLAADRAQLAATPEGVFELAWRGSIMSLSGLPVEAIGDLTLVIERFDEGLVDIGGGTFHALQAFAHFLNGQWARASILLDLARTGRLKETAAITISMLPLEGVISADADRWRNARAIGRRARLDAPQPVAVQSGDIAEVFALFFIGDEAEKRTWLAARVVDFGAPHLWIDMQVPYCWYLAQGLAADWAGRAADVPRWASMLRTADAPPWGDDVADWLEARADRSPAGAKALAEIAQRGLPMLPTVDAMRRVDAAQRAPASVVLRSEASAALHSIGADRLAARLLPEAHASESGSRPWMADLSEREREVAALVLEGLSYAQIAKELFITRSTVAFHLSRIYAKTGTTSRHEFVEAVRRS